jgi:hypothetical protein
MNTKVLMISSSFLMGITGIFLIFLPDQAAKCAGLKPEKINILFIQMLGSLYFAFAMVNWTAREKLIGGIYGRTISTGNFAHFFIGGLILIRGIIDNSTLILLWIMAIIYTLFAIIFTRIIFGALLRRQKQRLNKSLHIFLLEIGERLLVIGVLS